MTAEGESEAGPLESDSDPDSETSTSLPGSNADSEANRDTGQLPDSPHEAPMSAREDAIPGTSGIDIDELLEYDDHIYQRRELVESDFIPDDDRIVGRDDELTTVVTELRGITKGEKPSNILVYGLSGTGKSLVAKAVADRIEGASQRADILFGYVHVDCAQHNSEAQAIAQITRGLNDPAQTGFEIPSRGVATGWLYDRLWTILDEYYDTALIILDEVDHINGRDGTDDREVLFQLSRAKEAGKIATKLGIVGISNDIHYPDDLGSRVRSSFNPVDIVFSSYDAEEIRDILGKRRDAFKSDALTDDVIPLTAALAGQEHGDARKGIDILRNAGDTARDSGASKVTERSVRFAAQAAEVDRVRTLMRGTPTQAKLALLALAALSLHGRTDIYRSSTVYKTYMVLGRHIDMDRLSQRRVIDLLREHETSGLIGLERTGGGRGGGVYYECHLAEDSEVVYETLIDDSRLDDIDELNLPAVVHTIIESSD